MLALVSLVALFSAATRAAAVLDTHVHLTNISLLNYSLWGNASAGVCPCAPPCLCDWTTRDYQAASLALPVHKVVFVEVDVVPSEWLAEAEWVQSISTQAGSLVGAIVAQPPPGFGVPGAPQSRLMADLDRLARLPLARGVRGAGANWSDPATVDTLIAHTALLAERQLSFDIIHAVHLPGAADGILRVAAAVPTAIFILDHVGSPPVLGSAADMAAWSAAMARLGAQPNIYCKIGGILQAYKSTEIVPTPAVVGAVAEVAIRAFSFSRAAFECNWFFVNWKQPARLDMCAVWQSMLATTLDSMGATPAERDMLYASSGALAYRVNMQA